MKDVSFFFSFLLLCFIPIIFFIFIILFQYVNCIYLYDAKIFIHFCNIMIFVITNIYDNLT